MIENRIVAILRFQIKQSVDPYEMVMSRLTNAGFDLNRVYSMHYDPKLDAYIYQQKQPKGDR
jgi:hypothetical protein